MAADGQHGNLWILLPFGTYWTAYRDRRNVTNQSRIVFFRWVE